MFAARAMNVRIYAVKNENLEYKIQKAHHSHNDYDKEREEVFKQLQEENEELKSRVDQLENQYQRKSTADPTLDRANNNNKNMVRSRSPVPTFPRDMDTLISRHNSKDDRRDREEVHMINNGSGSISAANYYQGYASPATKSAVSDRSWIDNNQVNQNASLDSAQLIIEKLTKVISHLQNELSKNTMLISQLMEENR